MKIKSLRLMTLILIALLIITVHSAYADPKFVEHKPLQRPQPSLGKTLSDIESHMTAGHIYRDSDKSTWGHETVHGINSLLRNKHTSPQQSKNGFYVFDGKGVIIDEPNCTLSDVAKNVPPSLRRAKYYDSLTPIYQTYLVDATKSPAGYGNWNDRPLYVFDEWTAYAAGTKISTEHNRTDRIEGDALHLLQFNVFALSLAYTCKTDDVQFKEFLKWNLHRSMMIVSDAIKVKDMKYANDYWKLVCYSEDAESLREFTRNYLGKEWVKTNLGF